MYGFLSFSLLCLVGSSLAANQADELSSGEVFNLFQATSEVSTTTHGGYGGGLGKSLSTHQMQNFLLDTSFSGFAGGNVVYNPPSSINSAYRTKPSYTGYTNLGSPGSLDLFNGNDYNYSVTNAVSNHSAYQTSQLWDPTFATGYASSSTISNVVKSKDVKLNAVTSSSLGGRQFLNSGTFGGYMHGGNTSFYEGAQARLSVGNNELTGDPVSNVTGAFYIDAMDLSLPGAIPLQLRRNYNSQSLANTLMGHGWKFSLMPYILLNGEGAEKGATISAADPNGSVVLYRRVLGEDCWVPQSADNPMMLNSDGITVSSQSNPFKKYILKAVDDKGLDTYTLHHPDGSKTIYKERAYPLPADTSIERRRPYLVRHEDNVGNYLNFSFYQNRTLAEYGQLERIVNNTGHFLRFNYNRLGQIVEVFASDGRHVYYEYDRFGDLVRVRYPDGSEVKYEYKHEEMVLLHPNTGTVKGGVNNPETALGSHHLLTKVIKPDGRILINEYDDLYDPNEAFLTPDLRPENNLDPKYRRVVKQWNTQGSDMNPILIATYEYIEDGFTKVGQSFNVTKVIAEGLNLPENDRSTWFVHSAGVIRFIADAKADKTAFAAGNTDIDHVISYTYAPIDVVEAALPGSPTVTHQSLRKFRDKRGLERSYDYIYNSSDSYTGNLKRMTIHGDVTGDGVDDSARNQTSFVYNGRNQVVKTILPAYKPGAKRSVLYTEYGAPANGELSDTDPEKSNYKEYLYKVRELKSYYTANPTIDLSEPSASDLYKQQKFYYLESSGAVHGLLGFSEERDAAGKLLTQSGSAYDSKGYRIRSDAYPLDGSGVISTHYRYNNKGQVIAAIDPAGRTTRNTYDILGRVIKVEQYANESAKVPLAWGMTYYNDNGEVSWQDGSRYDPEDYVLRDYDAAGRVIAEIHWRSEGKRDGSGVEAVSGQDYFLSQSMVTYTYNDFGSLVKQTDPLGRSTHLSSDALSQVIERQHADGSTVSMTYDPGGKVLASTNTQGAQIHYSYTVNGRLLRIDYADGSFEQYRYHLDGRPEWVKRHNSIETHYTYHDVGFNDSDLTDMGAVEVITKYAPTQKLLSKGISIVDKRGKEVRTISFADAHTRYEVNSQYDGLGRIKRTEGPGDYQLGSEVMSVPQIQTYRYRFDNTLNQSITEVRSSGTLSRSVQDALGRALSTEVYAGNALLKSSSYTYDPKHHWVTVKIGTIEGEDLSTTTYTDVSGNPVIVKDKSGKFTHHVYDKLGAPKRVITKTGHAHHWRYDNRGRVRESIEHGGVKTLFTYDTEGRLLRREMPGGLTQHYVYNNLGQLLESYLENNGSRSNELKYSYFTAGVHRSRLDKVQEMSGSTVKLTRKMHYDEAGRVREQVSTGPYYAGVRNAYAYDLLGRTTEKVRSSTNVSASQAFPSVRQRYTYDGYGQLIEERINLGIGGMGSFASTRTASHFLQKWDARGRRTELRTGNALGLSPAQRYRYTYTQADQLERIADQHGHSLNYTYLSNSLPRQMELKDGANVLKRAASGYDAQGRLTQRDVDWSGQNILSESLTRRGDGKILAVAAQRSMSGQGQDAEWGQFAENRSYTYNGQGRLISERYLSDPTGSAVYKTQEYRFDPNNLGVLTEIKSGADRHFAIDGASNDSLTGMDSLYRSTQSLTDNQTLAIDASGLAVGPGAFRIYTAATHSPQQSDFRYEGTFTPNPERGVGQWTYPLLLKAGANTIRAEAVHTHPESSHSVSDERQVTVTETAMNRVNSYDHGGRLVERLLLNGQVRQRFIWDANGKLARLEQRDLRSTKKLEEYNMSFVYDCNGNRLQSSYHPISGTAEVSRSIYEPLSMNMELAVEHEGKRHWKLQGLDINGSYSGLEGIGGLHAIVDEASGELTPILQDVHGHVIGHIETEGTAATNDDRIAWHPVQYSGYGALTGYVLKSIHTAKHPAEAYGWKGRRADPSNLICMGARYYDSQAGRFISTDPLGTEVSPDLYNYPGNGDPINYADPTGLKGASNSAANVNAVPSGNSDNDFMVKMLAAPIILGLTVHDATEAILDAGIDSLFSANDTFLAAADTLTMHQIGGVFAGGTERFRDSFYAPIDLIQQNQDSILAIPGQIASGDFSSVRSFAQTMLGGPDASLGTSIGIGIGMVLNPNKWSRIPNLPNDKVSSKKFELENKARAENPNYDMKDYRNSHRAYHGTHVHYNQIFEEGITVWRDDMHLRHHATMKRVQSGYASTSKSEAVGKAYGDHNFLVRVRSGFDVNEALGENYKYRNEQEIAVPGGVPPYDIEGVFLKDGTFIKNPNFIPDDKLPD